MKPYPKIDCLYKRDVRTKRMIYGEFRSPEYEYLKNCQWEFHEKVDGTNIRVNYSWEAETLGYNLNCRFGGRTDNAEIPEELLHKLGELFPRDVLDAVFPKIKENHTNLGITLYGEGYGRKIQTGDKYIEDGVDFVLFDVKIGSFWLQTKHVEDIAKKLGIRSVPFVGTGTIKFAEDIVRNGHQSYWGNFPAEGLVIRPQQQLFDRQGNRIIAKVKAVDYG